MPLPSSGPISLSDIQAEFGGTNPISLSEYYKGGAYVLTTDYAPNVPTSGTISLSNFYGARRTTLITQTFTSVGDNLFTVPAGVTNLTIVSMVGGGGGGGGNDSQSGYPGYGGRTVTGGNISVSPGDVVNAYVAGGGGAGTTGGGGGGGGGGKIICTKLYELGLMSKEIYEADQAFGAELVKRSPDIYNGYRAWAEIVVDWMNGQSGTRIQSWAISWAQDIATPWAEHMAYKMGTLNNDNLTGRWISHAGIPICKAVGVWQRVFGSSKKPAGFGKGLMLIPVFIMFKLVAELGRIIEGKKL
jgi:hypothetical protein